MTQDILESAPTHERLRIPPQGAGFWIRGIARVIDVLINAGVDYVAGMTFQYIIIAVTLMARSPSGQVSSQAMMRIAAELNDAGLLALAVGFLSLITYHTIFEGLCWTTPGKALLGLIVLKQDGTPPDLKAALVRTLGFFIDGLFLGAIGAVSMLSSPMRQRRGDKYAQTVVIRQRDLRRQSLQREHSLLKVSLIVVATQAALMAIYYSLELII